MYYLHGPCSSHPCMNQEEPSGHWATLQKKFYGYRAREKKQLESASPQTVFRKYHAAIPLILLDSSSDNRAPKAK